MNNDNERTDMDLETDELGALLADAGLGVFPDDIQAEVDELLLPGQSLEPESRRRLIAAAGRATRERALREHGALETLLFETRRKLERSVEDLSSVTGMAPSELRAIERGERRLDSCDAASVAAWTLALTVDRDSLSRALRRSLGSPAGEPAYAAQRDVHLTQDQEHFVNEVLRIVDERTEDRNRP